MSLTVSEQLTPGLVHTPFLDGLPNPLNDKWRKWLAAIGTAIDQAPSIPVTVPLSITGAVGTTPFPIDTVRTGAYRINVYTRITVPATVNSSAQITIGWTEDGQTCTRPLTANTGNAVDSTESDVEMINVDGGTAITYSVAYASNAAGMQAKAVMVVEQLGE